MGGKARWTEVDRGFAVAYERWLNGRHEACGTRQEDWFDDDGWPLAEPVYEAVLRECEGCRSIERARRGIEESDYGVYVTLVPLGTSPVLASDDEQIEDSP